MKKIYKRSFLRNDNKHLFLYGFKEHKEKGQEELNISNNLKPHMRWNPSRQEWVTYSEQRKNRTFFPPKKYCPLCPGAGSKVPTEIPFKNFEVAVFPNRWASFNELGKKISSDFINSQPSKGECEVVVYSSEHSKSVAEMQLDRIKLLIYVWIDRYINLLKNKSVKYVLPFENRGEECGVTLHHPHGQIYAYPFVPPAIKKEQKAFKKENFLLSIMTHLKKKYYTYQDKNVIAFVPPFARYAYEVWIAPKRQVPGPWALTESEIVSLAYSIKKVIRGYDKFLGKRCPYVMGLHSAPKLKDKNYHFHIEFYPPLRHGDKPKILAGSESMAGVFIMDVLPENSAKELRKFMK